MGVISAIFWQQMPSRLTTLQKACTEAQFNANPGGCPAGSVVGTATVYTPLLENPLTGPAIFVSHGGAKFPELIIVLQGEGLTIDLAGETFINGKTGITSSTFNAVPDVPFSAFDLKLPEGPYSALGFNGTPCTSSLLMPTTITAQNGTIIKQATHIAVAGCPKAKTAAIKIIKASTRGHELLVTLKTSSAGRIELAGPGLWTLTRTLNPGSHKLAVSLTNAGIAMLHHHHHHQRAHLRATLTVAKNTTTKTTNLQL